MFTQCALHDWRHHNSTTPKFEKMPSKPRFRVDVRRQPVIYDATQPSASSDFLLRRLLLWSRFCHEHSRPGYPQHAHSSNDITESQRYLARGPVPCNYSANACGLIYKAYAATLLKVHLTCCSLQAGSPGCFDGARLQIGGEPCECSIPQCNVLIPDDLGGPSSTFN